MEDVGVCYDLDSVHSSRIRTARRRADGKRVVIKVARTSHPGPLEEAEIQHEHALLRILAGAPVPVALDVVRIDHGLGLVLEDLGRHSLDRVFGNGPLDIKSWLELALGAAQAVEQVHARGVLHKDIAAQHFFVVEGRDGVILIDFDIATTGASEDLKPEHLDAPEGTLAYIAPEQTGRMNRSVDRRSDLYSLGVTLYELLVGVLPFRATDPLELVHCHIARRPAAPHEVRPDVPEVVSAILLRLLEKVAENRYQTAAGLCADLRRCLARLEPSGAIEPFALGQDDQHGELTIPQKLYGREVARETLLAAFAAARQGHAQLALLSGASGIGKSALVHEIHKELVHGGSFVEGKFDQFGRTVPYSALAQACAELVRAELCAPAEALEAWTRRVKDAVGTNGQLLIDIVPAMQLAIGCQPPVAALGPNESQKRFEHTFQRFVAACASPEQPLVLFLDDLQWADAASLRLLQLVLDNHEQRHLLVIGNYRDAEVGALHPLRHFIDEVAKSVAIHRIELVPLRLEHMTELLRDTLHRTALHEVEPLARLIVDKTGGNPFFASQFLDRLCRDGLLRFDARGRRWVWEIEAVESAGVTENVVELLVAKISRLDPGTRTVLEYAACIGHRFDSKQLAMICEASSVAVAEQLWPAIEQGFVVPLDKNYRLISSSPVPAPAGVSELGAAYRFAHDRIQQAAYAMIAESERGPRHLRIARLLSERYAEGAGREQDLFEITSHFNLARDWITDPDERLRLCHLNLEAAARAQRAAAHQAAEELAGVAASLLGPDAWQAFPDEACAAQRIRAECRYLASNMEGALEAIEFLEQHARTPLERVPARNLKTLILTHQNRLRDALDTSVETLRLLGMELPKLDDKTAIVQAIGDKFGAFQAALAERSIEALAELPPMLAPEKLALSTTLAQANPAAFQWDSELMALLVLEAVQLPLRYGTAPESPFFYAQYAVVHAVATGDHPAAYRFGQLGLRLAEQPGHEAARGAVHFLFGALCSAWSKPLSESLEHFQRGVRTGLDAGDPMHAGYCLSVGSAYRLYAGEPLARMVPHVAECLATLTSNQDVINSMLTSITQQTMKCLSGHTREFGRLDDTEFSEATFEAQAPPSVAGLYGAHKAMVRYLAGFAAEALAAAETFRPLPMLFYNAEYSLYRALALLELARSAEPVTRAEFVRRAQMDMAQHERWANGCGPNFAHRHSLLRAELLALEGQVEKAMAEFDRAIEQASAHGFIQHAALAYELCGRFHFEAGRKVVARAYLVEARYQYERWGASAKVAQLTQRYPEMVGGSQHPEPAGSTATARRRTARGGDGTLDLLSAMRAAQAIASELVLDRLIERLLRILLENGGAQRGFLILPDETGWAISAAISVDPDHVELGSKQPLANDPRLPVSVVQYVARSREAVVLDDAAQDKRFAKDAYLSAHNVRSILCLPLLHHGRCSALLYLENAVTSGAFHAARLERLRFLAAHAAVAIENAKLYGEVQSAREKLVEANRTLEQKVHERTAALSNRSADMRRLLDNVQQGLITLDMTGKILPERSLAAESWFGPFGSETSFARHMRRFDPHFAEAFDVMFEMFADGVLSTDLALSQLPAELRYQGRQYRASYSLIGSNDRRGGVLVVMSDETAAAQHAHEEAAQREQLALCQRFARDRSGLLEFMEEGDRLVEQLMAPTADRPALQPLLHTLKGTAGMFGLNVLAELCHAAEDALAKGGAVGDTLCQVQRRWAQLSETARQLTGQAGKDRLEISRPELERLVTALREGEPVSSAISALTRWQLEPVERPLSRLAEHAGSLAVRLGKAAVQVDIDGGGVLTEPELSRPLWSVLNHVIRNAADHGFETEDERAASGKPACNRLRASAHLDGSTLSIEIADDGRGVDWERVRRLARERGLPSTSRVDLVAALLAPSITTRTTVTSTSGRGVGMAAVEREVRALGGTLTVDSETSRGCIWIINLPSDRVGAVTAHADSRPSSTRNAEGDWAASA
jgi:predicted ATPase/GAF domain-containing protein/HPt (histidine-containing phosphotransfer) domain-containing protein